MFKNIKLSLKLTSIGLAFVLPLGVLLYIAIANINAQIQFSRLETEGNTMQRPLEKLLENLPKPQVTQKRLTMLLWPLQTLQKQNRCTAMIYSLPQKV